MKAATGSGLLNKTGRGLLRIVPNCEAALP